MEAHRTADVLVEGGLTFSQLGLLPEVLAGLELAGFVHPSPIQARAIPEIQRGKDVIVQAKSGTGKTCVFAIAALEAVAPGVNAVQALVLCATREVALQTAQVIQALGANIDRLQVAVLVGGLPISAQKAKLAKGAQIVVGTPGRVLALLETGLLVLRRLRLLVLDEADCLLGATIRSQVTDIVAQTPSARQTLAVSATFTAAQLHQIQRFLNRGVHVQLSAVVSETPDDSEDATSAHNPDATAASPSVEQTARADIRAALEGVTHYFIPCMDVAEADTAKVVRAKYHTLLRLLGANEFGQAIIFCNRAARPGWLAHALTRDGWTADYIDGHLTQHARNAALQSLTDRKIRILVATDLVARGVDTQTVSWVIHYDLSPSVATYLHRVGRAGRFGSYGVSVSLVTGSELSTLSSMCGRHRIPLSRLDMSFRLPQSTLAREEALLAAVGRGVSATDDFDIDDAMAKEESAAHPELEYYQFWLHPTPVAEETVTDTQDAHTTPTWRTPCSCACHGVGMFPTVCGPFLPPPPPPIHPMFIPGCVRPTQPVSSYLWS